MSEEVLEKASAREEDTSADTSDTQQYVTFLVGREAFAVEMAPVQEIIRVPDVVRVPLAPRSLNGLANLRGRVLPIISLRHIFGFAEQAHDDSTRAVVIDLGQPLGFVVDRVASVVNVEPSQIEPVSDIRSTIDSDLLTGILKDVSGQPMVMVLDFAHLIDREFAEIESLAQQAANRDSSQDGFDETSDNDDNTDELQLVSFSVADQEYAIDISRVQEIVQIPETIVQVPNSASHVIGLMTLREKLLPLVSLRSMFGLVTRELDERSRIVVVSLGSAAVGVVTDSVSEVLRVPSRVVDAMPGLLSRDGEMADIGQICRLDNGKRLVSIISAENMFRHSAVRDALKTVSEMNDTRQDDLVEDTENDDEEQVVVFHLAAGEFGVPIESVQEIVRVPDELTHVPKAPSFVEGVINLRGSVLPVIDQRKRLDLPPIERNDRQRIMVFLLHGVRTGFIVDAVTEVLKIAKTAIEASPRLSTDQARLLGRVANLQLQGRMIQLVDPAYLVDDADGESLAHMET